MANRRMMRSGDVRLETQGGSTARGLRSPRDNYCYTNLGEGQLYGISFMPVLAGDTVKSMSLNARIVGQSVAGDAAQAVIGKWFETWVFYVRIGDLAQAEDIRQMLVGGPAISFQYRSEVMAAIWDAYFVDEKETAPWLPAGPNVMRYPGTGWWDSATPEATLPDAPAGGDGSEWQTQWARFEAMRRSRLTTQTFEEYLAMQGVTVPPQLRVEHDPEMKVPEMLHYSREFAYPQASGFATDGAEQYRVQWFKQDQVSRSRFCAEPGFLVTCVAVRPKAYTAWAFDALELLEDAAGWLPPEFDTDPHTSLVEIPASYFGDTVPGAATVVDVRDLYLHGTSQSPAPVGVVPSYSQRYPVLSATYSLDISVAPKISSRVSRDTTA